MPRPLVIRTLFAALLLASAHVSTARGFGLSVTPADPLPQDTIDVDFQGEFAMGLCWKVESRTCTFVAPDSLIVTASIQYCNGAQGCFCTTFPTPYSVSCQFPPLPVGTYTVLYREVNLNVFDTRTPFSTSRTFTVTAPTPTLKRSWGSLKAIYR